MDGMDAFRRYSIRTALIASLLLISASSQAGETPSCTENCLVRLSAMDATYPGHGPIRLITENIGSQIIYVNVGLEYLVSGAWTEALASVNAPPGRKGTILALVRGSSQFRITLDPDQPSPSSTWKAYPVRFKVDVYVDGRPTQKVYSSQFRLIP
jgi:hypothetical protein